MNPSKSEPNTKNTNSPAQAAPATAPAPQPTKGKTKSITVQLSEDVHQKLQIVALSKGATTSGLVESYVDAALKKDLIVAAAKLSE